MIKGLHHIAIAVRSIDEALPRYIDGLGLHLHSVEEVPTEQVKVAVVLAGETRLELLEPTDPQSAVARFLDKQGPGIHHLAFEVDGLNGLVKVLAGSSVPLVPPAPRPGAHGTSVAFLHPRHLGGVLVELVENPL